MVESWEHERDCPELVHVPAICDVYRVSPDDLLGRAPAEPPAPPVCGGGPDDPAGPRPGGG